MTKTLGLISFLVLIGACDTGENTEGGECYYSPQVEVPRAEFDAAADDGQLSAAACEELCNEFLDVEDSGGPEQVQGPDCIVKQAGTKRVLMECRVDTSCA